MSVPTKKCPKTVCPHLSLRASQVKSQSRRNMLLFCSSLRVYSSSLGANQSRYRSTRAEPHGGDLIPGFLVVDRHIAGQSASLGRARTSDAPSPGAR